MVKKVVLTLIVAIALLFVGGLLALRHHAAAVVEPDYWEATIQSFEEADAGAPPQRQIVFIGSSSIRLWEDLEEDMAPLPVLNRGFGGAHMSHLVHNAERIVTAYTPRAVVVYGGDNDIGAGKPPETIAADFASLVERLRSHQPDLSIYFITIKPSRRRWDQWRAMSEANALIARMASADRNLAILDVSRPMLDLGQGEAPPADLFWIDGLHLSEQGYAIWAEVVSSRLMADLGCNPPKN
jgi:lysophospholipase L1-like esterase